MPTTLEHQDRLAFVDAALVAFARRVPDVCGGRWGVVRGSTTDAQQAALYAKGRTVVGENPTPERPLGKTVTNARNAHETAHGMRRFGACAVDFVALNDDGSLDWTPPRYQALGEFAKRCGFEWGGDFRDPKTGKPMQDLGHVQVANWRSIPADHPSLA